MSLFNLDCIYAFRADHLGMNNHLSAHDWGKLILPLPADFWFLASHPVMESCKISPIHVSMSAGGVIVQAFLSSHKVRFHGCSSSVITIKQNLSADFRRSGSYNLFYPPLIQYSQNLRFMGYLLDVSINSLLAPNRHFFSSFE